MSGRSEGPRRQCLARLSKPEKPAADQSRWAWVEHCVWTPCMLAALEHGVKGGKWPNAFFVARWLFNMEAARAVTRQSACGQPPTGEPCAGDPHARFGGRGDREPNRSSLPL